MQHERHYTVEQASAAQLTDLHRVLIGTSNPTQSLDRKAVVVIHPLVATARREAGP